MATVSELQARLAAEKFPTRGGFSSPRVGHVLAEVAASQLEAAFAPLRQSVQPTVENAGRKILDNAWENALTWKR
jgi:hypothetical protein